MTANQHICDTTGTCLMMIIRATTLAECISTREFRIMPSIWWLLCLVDLPGSELDQYGTQACLIRNSMTLQMLLVEKISITAFLSSPILPATTPWNCLAAM